MERWYPKKLPAGDRLAWYAQHFDLVEVNSTFYSAPEPRMVERWCAATPDDFTFDVKLHQLFSFHSTPAKLLPPDLQSRVETDAKGKVKPTRDVQEALLKVFLRATAIFRSAGKMGVLLLQLSPAFSPRKHELNELEPLIEMLNGYELAIEFRNRNWAIGDQLQSTIDFVRKHGAIFVNVDAPASDHFTVMRSDVDEVTNSNVAYLRLHGRNAKAYITGKTVAARFDYDYNEKEIAEVAERSRKLAKRSARVACDFQQQQSRLRAAGGDSSTQGAGPNRQCTGGDIGVVLARKENVQRSTPNIQRRTKRSIAARTDARDSVIRCWAFDVGCSAFSAKLGDVETTEGTQPGEPVYESRSAKAAGAVEEMVGRASHDVDDDRRHAALDRSRVGDRNFLRVHSAVSAKDIAVDRSWRGFFAATRSLRRLR